MVKDVKTCAVARDEKFVGLEYVTTPAEFLPPSGKLDEVIMASEYLAEVLGIFVDRIAIFIGVVIWLYTMRRISLSQLDRVFRFVGKNGGK